METPEAGGWLLMQHGVESEHCVTMTDAQFSICSAFRLGIPFLRSFMPAGLTLYCQCGAEMDEYGEHIMACCHTGRERIARHNSIAVTLASLERMVGGTTVLEPRAMCCGEHRPDVYVRSPLDPTVEMAIDVTVTSTHSGSAAERERAATASGAAAAQRRGPVARAGGPTDNKTDIAFASDI